ncbi:iron-siderophore ABC transporter substrate-binding protein [Paenibacillus sp. JCM 10914]|uniref:ABC transporter substrate-binding protein n=1 Tax=Paenibacillus sp. JCM 10914 TaxID=1236974 RepID=UPI0003CC3C67|nr:iron-siderophore ABC transporter substrate-binding protein [Paenibacillus sp. JCM 10914]GAE06497.1 periplasmic binding protein [Paenibacillus sp. JCM 10914]
MFAMKKGLLTMIAIMMACVLLLSACGNADNKTTEQETTSTSAVGVKTEDTDKEATPEAPIDEPRTVQHAMGETVLTGTPERVVVLTQEGTEAVLELGIIPVGAVNSGLGDSWFSHIADEMQGVKELGDESQPNVELILELQPDLIIGNKIRHELIYDQLKEIAPTVFSEDLAGQWKNNFKLYSEALGKVADGEAVMASYDAHIADAKRKLESQLTKEVSIVRFLPQAVRIYQKDTFAGVILQDLGFARPASQDVDNFMEVIDKERIADMDGDVMFYFNADYDEEKGGTLNQQEWMNDPLYANLDIAKNDTAFQVDEVVWNLAGGIKAANLLVNDIVRYMEGL